MSDTRSTKIGIPDHRESHVRHETQYGVVWPDGTHTWQTISRGAGMTEITIAALVPGVDTSGYPNQTSAKWSHQYWDELLASRATAAKLDVDEYQNMHRFIKRDVVLSVTATEAL